MVKTCATCGQATARFRCQDCDGYGGEWVLAAWKLNEQAEYIWQRCAECAGVGTVERCTALVCASRASSPVLTVEEARFVDAALARLVAGEGGE